MHKKLTIPIPTTLPLFVPLRLPYKAFFSANLCPVIRIHLRVYVELLKNG
jgi:hypothetical protein